MILRGIKFGNVFNSSGARGFFGEGYWYHSLFSPIGLDYSGTSFIAKTTTLNPRRGNMPLAEDGFRPQQLIPSCIKISPIKGAVLNSVGLSGPGAQAILDKGWWQTRTEPFLISFMSVEDKRVKRNHELNLFVQLLKSRLQEFKAPIGLQINFSCPNTGLDLEELYQEIRTSLELASRLEIPIIPKVNALFPIDMSVDLSQDLNFDALSVSNTIPWNKVSEQERKRLFGSEKSPLAHLGGGGVSGAPFLLDLTARWISRARERGFEKPILGGGGVLKVENAEYLLDSGASAIELGSVSMLRPWRVKRIVEYVNLRTCDA